MKVFEALQNRSNDYSQLDFDFFKKTKKHLYEKLNLKTLNLDNYPSISVIIPYFNAEDTISLVLKALNNQKFPASKFEVILVDDGSTNNVKKILKKIASELNFDYQLITHHRNSGRACARNTGASLAKNELLLFLDADMISPPELLFAHAIKHSFYKNLLLASMAKRTPLTKTLRKKILNKNFNFSISAKEDWRYHSFIAINKKSMQISNIIDTNFFKDFGQCFKYYSKTLPEMVISSCVSIMREQFYKIGGFCEKFITYGREDIFFGAMSIAFGLFIIPDLNVLYQLDDKKEIKNKLKEFHISMKLYNELLQEKCFNISKMGQQNLTNTKKRIFSILSKKNTKEQFYYEN